jgi:hypothetical protein
MYEAPGEINKSNSQNKNKKAKANISRLNKKLRQPGSLAIPSKKKKKKRNLLKTIW